MCHCSNGRGNDRVTGLSSVELSLDETCNCYSVDSNTSLQENYNPQSKSAFNNSFNNDDTQNNSSREKKFPVSKSTSDSHIYSKHTKNNIKIKETQSASIDSDKKFHFKINTELTCGLKLNSTKRNKKGIFMVDSFVCLQLFSAI